MVARVLGSRSVRTCTVRPTRESQPIARLLNPAPESFVTPEQFERNYLRQSRPAFFPALVSHPSTPFRWPACQEWTYGIDGKLSGLRDISDLQDALVDVEISPKGRGYGDAVTMQSKQQSATEGPKWMKVTMPFGLFLDAFIEGKIPSRNDGSVDEMVGYLAQQDLFEKSKMLANQCPILPHTMAGPKGAREQWRRNVWIGGAHSFTPIHNDPYENVFVQVAGIKRFHLFPPSVGPSLHLFSSTTRQANTSSIPTEKMILSGSDQQLQQAFPEATEALAHADTCHVILQGGDVLYVPRGWYHCVQSLSISASVNAWFR